MYHVFKSKPMESNKSHIFNGLQDITGQEGTQDPETPLEPYLFFKGPSFGPVFDLDAFAVGLGENVFPPSTVP